MTPELRQAVERELASRPGAGMWAGAASLSIHYRAGGRSDASIDLAAYLAMRLPATLAAMRAVLEDVRQALLGFAPHSVLDAGSGHGTASWAAAEAWPGDLVLCAGGNTGRKHYNGGYYAISLARVRWGSPDAHCL